MPGYATPFPESPYSSSPAWNPDSDLLPVQPDLDLDQTSSTHVPVPHNETEHTLLDEWLIDAPLRVIVTGGFYNQKKVTALVKSLDGQLSILYKCYTTSTPLSPEWVTPKSPNLT